MLRSIHLHLGVFTAPMLLFFAVTGGLQTFGLHETTRGGSYAPPAWLASAAQLHKKQTLTTPQRRRPPLQAADDKLPPAPERRAREEPVRAAQQNLLPMKAFFALVALGLLVSVLSGLYMAWRFTRRPGVFGAVFGAGILVPLLLLLF
ncbi:PepSY domain-containing protein [Rhodanobacter ginsengiterrae]|uniref:PepSY domain-containing protein n=1 Tax=Rhodanobacter ginsengiterrae TaxID=2008451 RepID=UPI003CEDE04A